MTEKSIFWTTGALGDGAAEYTMAELTRWLRQTYLSDNTDEGVLKNYGGELAVSGVASPVSIATGGALVYGFPYWSTTASTLAIPTPVGDTRIDRVVLEADWTAQTVRIARVAGAEGGAAPALTQIDGTTWQISLAQASITVGGVITVTDERVFVHPNWEIEAGQFNADVVDGAIELSGGALAVTADDSTIEVSADNLQVKAGGLDNTHLANRTRRFLVPATECYNATDGTYENQVLQGWECVDAKICECYGSFRCPPDYAGGGILVYPVVIPNATGDLVARVEINYAAIGEAYNTHSETEGYSQMAVTQDEIEGLSTITPTLASITTSDYVLCTFLRNGTSVSDNIGDVVYFMGFYVSYTADM